MWLNPLKGDHLTLRQLDKTLPVDTSVASSKTIERGIFVYVSTNNIKPGSAGNGEARFALYTATQAALPNAVPYIALMGWKDTQASMAGNDVQAPATIGADDTGVLVGSNPDAQCPARSGNDEKAFINNVSTIDGAQVVRGPRITAISILQPAEWQTNAFDKTQADANYYVGAPLSVNNDGKLCPWTTGKNIVGYVTQSPAMRWVNDLGASEEGARISGGNSKCIAFSTAWIPVAAVASGEGKNVDVMSKGKPEVKVAAAAPAAPTAQAPAAPAAKAPAAPNAK